MTHKIRISAPLAGLAAAALLTVPMFGQTGAPDDWSHHHLIFSNPGTIVDALKDGKVDNWRKIMNNPRFRLQQIRRDSVMGSGKDGIAALIQANPLAAPAAKKPKGPPPPTSLERDWSMSMGSGAKAGAGQYPAKFSFDLSSANCDNAATPDFVVYATSLAGSGSQASIIAYDNLYSGCTLGANGNAKPNVYWQYDTNGGTIVTSPVLSPDGTQVAFVQTESSVAHLVVLKWSKSTTLTTLSSSGAGVCSPAPCMKDLAFSGTSITDTNSSPFYDYDTDNLYVGDNQGHLHKFTGVFNGTLAEPSTAVTVSTAASPVLTSPVLDHGSGLVFLGDAGGVLYSVNSSGTVVKSGQIGFHLGIVDGPVVDSSAQKVYAFVASDTGGHSGVFQFSTTFPGGNTGTEAGFSGSAATNEAMYIGAFDNRYYSSSNAASPTGNLWVCSGPGGPGAKPVLSYIPITSGSMGAVTNGPAPANGTAVCSPVSEILSVDATTTLTSSINNSQTNVLITSGLGFPNSDYIQIDSEIMKISSGGTTTSLTVTRAQLGTTAAAHSSGAAVSDIHDRLFLSVTASGSLTVSPACTGACVYSFDVTSGASPSGAVAGIAATGGSSGIIIDNTVVGGGGSQVYYSTLLDKSCVGNSVPVGNGTGGCAVQASQKALQ